MTTSHRLSSQTGAASSRWALPLPPPPLFLLQPLLAHVAKKIAAQYPEIFERLGPHQRSTYVIDAAGLPFALALRPDPDDLSFRAVARDDLPAHDARIAGKFFDLLSLVDCGEDGDAMFFSRGLDISGNVDAVVTLRNALDNVDGSIAASVADMFGPPGRLALDALRRIGSRKQDART